VAYDLSALSADLQQHRDALRESGISGQLAALHVSGAFCMDVYLGGVKDVAQLNQ